MPQFHNPPQAAIKQGVCVTDDMPIRPYANRLQYGLWERLQSSGENNETDNSVKNSRMITIHQRHFLLFSFCEKNRQRKKKKITAPPKISAFQIKCVDLPQIQHMLFSGKSFLRMKHFLLCENWNLLWPHEIDEFNEFCWSFLWRVTFLFFFWFFPPWNLMWVNYLESQSVQNDWATQHSGYFFFFKDKTIIHKKKRDKAPRSVSNTNFTSLIQFFRISCQRCSGCQIWKQTTHRWSSPALPSQAHIGRCQERYTDRGHTPQYTKLRLKQNKNNVNHNQLSYSFNSES